MNDKRINSLIIVVVAGIVSVVMYWVLVSPVIKQLVEGIAMLEAYDQKAAEQVTLRSTSEKARAALESEVQQRAQVVDPLLPEDLDPVDISIQVEALARVHGVTLAGIQAAEDTVQQKTASTQAGAAIVSVPNTKPLAVTVSILGEYLQVRQFIEALPSLNRELRIEEVSMAISNQQVGSTRVTASISLAAFTYVQ